MSISTALTRQYAANKGFAEDLTEGKFSFPIVHSIRADRGNTRILSAFTAPVSLR